MAAKKRGLGRGLNALIGGAQEDQEEEKKVSETVGSSSKVTKTKKTDGTASPAGAAKKTQEKEDLSGVQEIDIQLLSPDKAQPRKNFNEDALAELAESIRQVGVIQPLIVQKKEGYFQIIAGERRFRAALKAGLKKVPVLIREYNPQETLEVSLIENIQRENLDPIEEAQAYERLAGEYHLTQENIADRVGKSRPAIANALRLLKLDDTVRTMVAEGSLSTGHAKVLLGVENAELRQTLAKKCAEDGWSVRQLEKAVAAAAKASQKKDQNEAEEDDLAKAEALAFQAAEDEMQKILGTKVQILSGKKKGKIEIEYYSEDELERLLMLLRSLQG